MADKQNHDGSLLSLLGELNDVSQEALGTRPFYESMTLADVSRHLARIHLHYFIEMREMASMTRMLPQDQAAHDQRLRDTDDPITNLAVLLQRAAFYDKPEHQIHSDPTPAPVYLAQAFALSIRSELRKDILLVLNGMNKANS